VVINGSRLSHEMDGMRRAEVEIIKRLDKMIDSNIIELIVRKGYLQKPAMELTNIKVTERKNSLKKWEFINIDLYSLVTHALCVDFNNRAGYVRGIYLLNDIIPITYYSKMKERETGEISASLTYHKRMERFKKYSKPIVTVSEFCKSEFINRLGIKGEDIKVIHSSWEHIRELKSDDSIYERLGINKGEYFFSLGSVSPHKNFGFIAKLAVKNPSHKFVITGDMLHGFGVKQENLTWDNLIYTGRLTEGEVKALYEKCKAFIFPSFIEGFGLPPLEALGCGADVCVSDIPVMREICGESVRYFDPTDSDINIGEMLSSPVKSASEALSKFSWENTAKEWYNLIMEAISQ
jgi:glycosyltransferase involved in cell wall biosynthesis